MNEPCDLEGNTSEKSGVFRGHTEKDTQEIL